MTSRRGDGALDGARAPTPPGAAVAGSRRDREELLKLVVGATTGAVAVLVLLAYVVRASALVAYPWDWSPDEGLHLDYARRALESPASLYSHEVVPFPAAYGPLLPFITAPLVRLEAPLAGARLLALSWTLLGVAAVGWLLRRRAGRAWAAAGVALFLCPFDYTFWSMLFRVDGPMLTLWLWGAAALLPARLESGADRLTPTRLAAGTVLLLASALVKATAALHAAPLVLGWFFVHPRSAARLLAVLLASGLATLAVLQLATDGAFLWVSALWLLHPRLPGLAANELGLFLQMAWPLVALAAAAYAMATLAGTRPWREPSLLLVLGGLAAVPLVGKHGSSWNYLLPLHAALVIATVLWLDRAWGRDGGRRFTRARWAAPILPATVALALAVTRVFPVPTPEDAKTAQAFYRFTTSVAERAGGPLLVGRPELVYFLAGQPVEVDGTSFALLEAAGVPGTRGVLERLRDRRYTMVVETWSISHSEAFRAALHAGYRHVGACRLGWYFGPRLPSHVLLRRDLSYEFVRSAPGVRCAAVDPG